MHEVLNAYVVWGDTAPEFQRNLNAKIDERIDNGESILDIKFSTDTDGFGALLLTWFPLHADTEADDPALALRQWDV